MGRAATRMVRGLGALAMLGAGLGGAGPVWADDFTVGGALAAFDDVVLIEFTHPGGAFTAFTSHADSVNTLADSFDPQLQLFAGTGPSASFSTANDDSVVGFSTDVGGTTFTGDFFDSLIQDAGLAAGSYTLGLTAFNNDPAGPTLGEGYLGGGGNSGDFRVHLLGITEILSVQNPAPVSISAPPDNNGV